MTTTLRPRNKQPNSYQICWLQVYRGSFTASSHMVSITSIHWPVAEHLTSGSSSILPSLTCNWAPNMQSFPSSRGPRNLLSYRRSILRTLSHFSSHSSPCSLAKPITSSSGASVTFCTSSHSFQSLNGVVPFIFPKRFAGTLCSTFRPVVSP